MSGSPDDDDDDHDDDADQRSRFSTFFLVRLSERREVSVWVLVLGANYVLLSNQRSPAINFPAPAARTANMVTPPSLLRSLRWTQSGSPRSN